MTKEQIYATLLEHWRRSKKVAPADVLWDCAQALAAQLEDRAIRASMEGPSRNDGSKVVLDHVCEFNRGPYHTIRGSYVSCICGARRPAR